LIDIYRWEPSLSFGASIGRDFSSERWTKADLNLAVDFLVWTKTSIIINLDFVGDEVPGAARQYSVVETVAADWTTPIKLDLAFAGKFSECTGGCGTDSSTVKFGPSISYPVQKDTVLAFSLSWEAKAGSIGSAFAGLALSYSFGPKK
ncbi:MAG TPA: hypothetical protein VH083_12660, partial [Myxococcales bacterium]|jgi:hypothetical protein|nr:hypothetical protein [Myxococcales bacterium]